ncbi:unnamed protein product [Caenorhabditis angaria]|uniref:Uncharacterized protein n=1 Tax=Caenorhabditis angaria TaxID=860376 RepID=A0A9P1I7V9_9PELO|nr:unnamed protein product [Caenorhabditis angaria]
MVNLNISPFKLSMLLLRQGTAPFHTLSSHEVTKVLNKIGHFCLNLLISITFFLVSINITSIIFVEHKGIHILFDGLLVACIWLELAAVRSRTPGSLIFSAIFQIFAIGWYIFLLVNQLADIFANFYNFDYPAIINIFTFATIILYITRLFFLFILYKAISVKSTNFSITNTVFLKPTNTPVTFNSVLAPEPLDPTNPYHTKAVYNLNKSVC